MVTGCRHLMPASTRVAGGGAPRAVQLTNAEASVAESQVSRRRKRVNKCK